MSLLAELPRSKHFEIRKKIKICDWSPLLDLEVKTFGNLVKDQNMWLVALWRRWLLDLEGWAQYIKPQIPQIGFTLWKHLKGCWGVKSVNTEMILLFSWESAKTSEKRECLKRKYNISFDVEDRKKPFLNNPFIFVFDWSLTKDQNYTF